MAPDAPLYQPVKLAHTLATGRLHPGDIAIDATVGNGGDTVVLAQAVGRTGEVHGWDVQESALEIARHAVFVAGLARQVTFYHGDHAGLANRLPKRLHGQVAVAMFNLGYLPRGDQAITTRPASTVAALDAVAQVLAPGGLITIVAYVGHPGGAEEETAVRTWLAGLSRRRWTVKRYPPPPDRPTAPRLYAAYQRPWPIGHWLARRAVGAGD